MSTTRNEARALHKMSAYSRIPGGIKPNIPPPQNKRGKTHKIRRRGACVSCGVEMSLSKHGLIVRHSRWNDNQPCPGIGRFPITRTLECGFCGGQATVIVKTNLILAHSRAEQDRLRCCSSNKYVARIDVDENRLTEFRE